MALPSLRRPQ